MLQEESWVRKEESSDPMNSHLYHCNCPEALPPEEVEKWDNTKITEWASETNKKKRNKIAHVAP